VKEVFHLLSSRHEEKINRFSKPSHKGPGTKHAEAIKAQQRRGKGAECS